MDIERLKATLEVFYLRLKGLVRGVVRLVGICLVLLGGYNLLIAPFFTGTPILLLYTTLGLTVPAVPFATFEYDVLLIGVGAATTWFV